VSTGHEKIAILISLFALPACLSTKTTVVFKPGVTHEQTQRDLDQCKIASFQKIPQTLQTHVSGGYYNSGTLKCHTDEKGNTSCKRVGEYYQPPTTTTFDRNDALRWRFVQACLMKKGYALANNMRRCSNDAERSQAMQARTISDLTCDPGPDLDY